MVEYYKLSDDLEISRVLTGLWQIADLERDGKELDPIETSRHMEPYVEAGFVTFDMADHYGSAEIIAGTFLKNKSLGKKVQLFTKWVPKPGANTKDDVRKAVQLSLDRLDTDQIDMLQYHAWNYSDPVWLDSLLWLQELKEEGLIKHIGLTNFDSAHLRIAASTGVDILTNQISYSLIDQRASGEMTDVCREYGVKLLAFGTIAGGFLTEKWLDKPEPKIENLNTWSQMKYKRFIDTAGGWDRLQQLLCVLKKVSLKHRVSMANVTSAYMLQMPEVAAIILGGRLGVNDHVGENLKIFDVELVDEDIEAITNSIGILNPIPGGCGDEYRKPPFLTASGDLSDHLESIPSVFTPKSVHGNRKKVFSGTPWEDMAGYCRAVKSGNRILVSGTTATHGNLLIGKGDPTAQTHFVIDKIQAAIESLGGKLEDVDRTRIFVNNLEDWEPVARAHGNRFKDIQPANTLVQAKLVGEGYLVEIEAEARVN